MMRIHRNLLSGLSRRYQSTTIFMINDTQSSKQSIPLVHKRSLNEENTIYGLFAVRDIMIDELLVTEQAIKGHDKPDTYTIQRNPIIAESLHDIAGDHTRSNDTPLHLEMDPTLLVRYVNHSFIPNVAVQFNTSDLHQVSLRAIRRIAKDEEIFFNYKSTETQLASPFNDDKSGKEVC